MSTHSAVIITVILAGLACWLLWNFFSKRITSGQAIFWLTLLAGAEVLTLFPGLVDRLSLVWGDLLPVSWITFCALVVVIFYVLYLTVRLNRFRKFQQLARSVAYLERRVRELESGRERPAAGGTPRGP